MTVNRREVFQAAAVLGLSALSGSGIAQTSRRGAYFDPWIEIRADHIAHNLGQVRARVENRPVLAVIKNNAYGVGVTNMARILEQTRGIAGLAVVKLDEAITLREDGITAPILLMGPFDDRDLEEVVAHNIMPMVYTPIGKSLDQLAEKYSAKIPVHVCVDTGMGRAGVPFSEAHSLIEDLAGRSSVDIRGVMTTLTETPEFEIEQHRQLRSLVSDLAQDGVSTGRAHAASSYGLFQSEFAFMDMVRPGMSLYGCYPALKFRHENILQLKPAIALKARVIYVRHLKKGEHAGYEQAYTAKNDVWIATLPVGHVDGVPRVAAQGASVRIGETLYPVIASVSASHTLVEIGSEKTVDPGDVATIFDWTEGSRPEDIAEASGASVYDLLMHLSSLLPRTIIT